jgi:hypothetical protein
MLKARAATLALGIALVFLSSFGTASPARADRGFGFHHHPFFLRVSPVRFSTPIRAGFPFCAPVSFQFGYRSLRQMAPIGLPRVVFGHRRGLLPEYRRNAASIA